MKGFFSLTTVLGSLLTSEKNSSPVFSGCILGDTSVHSPVFLSDIIQLDYRSRCTVTMAADDISSSVPRDIEKR